MIAAIDLKGSNKIAVLYADKIHYIVIGGENIRVYFSDDSLKCFTGELYIDGILVSGEYGKSDVDWRTVSKKLMAKKAEEITINNIVNESYKGVEND